MGLTNMILALSAAYAVHGSPAHDLKHNDCPPSEWRSLFDQTELEKCEKSNATTDCTLLVDPDYEYLKSVCKGNFPYSYEVRAGNDTDPQPEVLVFCTRKEYNDAIANGTIRDYDFLEFLL